MKIVVFGASGKVGVNVVKELLQKNHEVTVFIYGNNPFEKMNNVRVISGNVKDQQQVKKALINQDAVISTLGSWGTKSKDILSTGIINIIAAMNLNNINRIISLTGSDAFLPNEKASLLRKTTRMTLGLVASKIISDGENHIKELIDSNLNWTVVRSPVMNDAGSNKFELDNTACKPWETINRLSVGVSMVSCLENNLHIKEAPFIHRI